MEAGGGGGNGPRTIQHPTTAITDLFSTPALRVSDKNDQENAQNLPSLCT